MQLPLNHLIETTPLLLIHLSNYFILVFRMADLETHEHSTIASEAPDEIFVAAPDEVVVIEASDHDNEEENHFKPKKRKKTSKAWVTFTELSVPGGTKATCKDCKAHFFVKTGGPTTSLLRHAEERCPKRTNIDLKQRLLGVQKGAGNMSHIANFKYDQSKVRQAAAYMILAHEYPFVMMEHEFFNRFMLTATPHYQRISRTTAKDDVMVVYNVEKKKLKEVLSRVGKVSITSDFWKSNQQIGYMCVTAHFISSDSDWTLQKKVISFCDVPPPHTGMVISDTILECLMKWGIEDKVSTVTFDNASNNDSAIKYLKENFDLKSNISYAGKIFHVRCCAHIINLMVQDGLTEVKSTIQNVRESVKYINGTEARLIKFGDIAKQLQLPHKKLILDVPTRWNSTYAMLEAALQFKTVFPGYKKRDPSYEWLPSNSDWERAKEVCQFLEIFKEATDSISGRDYPTSNLFLPVVWKIKEVLDTSASELAEEKKYIRAMAIKMKAKFDKYWGECNLLMAIAAVLDPRYKMVLINFCFPKIYPPSEVSKNVTLVLDALKAMYEDYVTEYTSSQCENLVHLKPEGLVPSSSNTSKYKSKGQLEFDLFVRSTENVAPVVSDLEKYLAQGVFISYANDGPFDAITWWKNNRLNFKILSKMAVDILSIPISTVASEAAFSIGGRVIDPYRASLSTETVEALICGGDWIRSLYGVKEVYCRTKDEDIEEINLP